MTAIVPFGQGAALPAYLRTSSKALASINQDVVSNGLGYPVLSIKGKVFTLVKDREKKILTRPSPDDPSEQEAIQSLTVSVVRANSKARVFYAKSYEEGAEGESARPDCYSPDGVAPGPDARTPQAKKCQACPHAVWGSKVSQDGKGTGKGTACSVNTRIAIVDPEKLADENPESYLLRVPAGSRSNFAELVKTADARGIPYNALAVRISFDKEAPSPKLVFRPVGLLGDAAYDKINSMFDTDVTKAMVGLIELKHDDDAEPAPEPKAKAPEDDSMDGAFDALTKPAAKKPDPVSADDLGAALGETKKPAAEAKPKAEAAPVKEAGATASVNVATEDSLLAGLDAMLGNLDD